MIYDWMDDVKYFFTSRLGTGGSVILVCFIWAALIYIVEYGLKSGLYLFWMEIGNLLLGAMVLVVVCWVIHLLYKGFVSIRNKLRRQR